jgi:hypothetical protein
VSHCPRAPELETLPQCANSAKDFTDYLRSTLLLPEENILSLFDSPLAASEQLVQIEEWLASIPGPQAAVSTSDLIVYYTGHGGISPYDQSYFLAVNRTKKNSEAATSIRYNDLNASLKRHATRARKFIILDCCFAAASILGIQADVRMLVSKRIEDELPSSGTAVLCSSPARLVSIAPPGARHTMFSGAFLQCLWDGVEHGPAALSLEDVCNRTRNIINEAFPLEIVRPELHVPDQSRGNPALLPMFPNVQYRPDEEKPSVGPPAPLLAREPPVARARWIDNAIGVLNSCLPGLLAGVLSAVAYAQLPFPYGISSTKYGPESTPPIAPAAFLALGILYQLYRSKLLTPKLTAFVVTLIYPAWGAAFEIHYWITLSADGLKVPKSLFGIWMTTSASLAGFVGAFLAYISVRLGHRPIDRAWMKAAVSASTATMIVAALSQALASAFNVSTAIFAMSLFLPWQLVFLNRLPSLLGAADNVPRPNRMLFAALCLVLAASNPIVARLTGPARPPVTVEVVKATRTPNTDAALDQSAVDLKLAISKYTPNSVTCSIEFVTSSSRSISTLPTDLDEDRQSVEVTIEVPMRKVGPSHFRLICTGVGVNYVTDSNYLFTDDE